jgi:hypothetical protein
VNIASAYKNAEFRLLQAVPLGFWRQQLSLDSGWEAILGTHWVGILEDGGWVF